MVNRRQLGFWLLIYLFVLGIISGSVYGQEQKDRLKIVVTTSLIGSIVQEVGEDRVEVITIVPSGMCPGHFDIRPGDIKVLEDAQVALEHGFEGELFVKDMLKLIENEDLLRVTLNVKGNWMVPDIHIQAVDRIVEVLSQVKPEYAELFKSKALDYKKEITNLARQIQQEAKELRVSEVKVVCSGMQAEFVDWVGFDIVATYHRPENFTPRQLKEIINRAKQANVKLVIDNLQSGAKAGVPIANEIKRPHLILTNFPQDFEGRLSYLNSLEENASKLFRAVEF